MSSFEAFLVAAIAQFPYLFLLPLIGSFFGGEETIILIAILSATDFIPFSTVLIFSYIGTLLSDSLWYWVGGRFSKWIDKREKIRKGFSQITGFATRIAKNNIFLILLTTKFLYGTRIVTIFYLARKPIPFLIFTLYNMVVTLLWATAICIVGWLTGRGITNLAKIFDNITYGIGIIALTAVALYALRIWLNRKIIEKEG